MEMAKFFFMETEPNKIYQRAHKNTRKPAGSTGWGQAGPPAAPGKAVADSAQTYRRYLLLQLASHLNMKWSLVWSLLLI